MRVHRIRRRVTAAVVLSLTGLLVGCGSGGLAGLGGSGDAVSSAPLTTVASPGHAGTGDEASFDDVAVTVTDAYFAGEIQLGEPSQSGSSPASTAMAPGGQRFLVLNIKQVNRGSQPLTLLGAGALDVKVTDVAGSPHASLGEPERIAGNPTDGAAVNPGEQGNVALAFLLSENTEAEKVSFAPAGGGPARASVSLGGKA